MAGNWKMNLNHQEAVVAGPEARLDARRQEARLRARSRSSSSRRSPTCAGADPRRRRPALDALRRAGRLRRTTSGAYTGEISAGDAGQARLHATSSSGTPSAASTTARATTSSTPRRTGPSAAGMTPDRVRRRGPRRPPGRRRRSTYTLAQVDGSLAGFTAEQVAGARGRLRAGVGDRHRRGRDAGGRAGGLRARSGPGARRSTATPRPTASASCTAARSRPRTSPGSWRKPDVDGALVGGASLQADEFGGICRFYDMPVL